MKNRLEQEYFKWMYSLVCDDSSGVTYHKLLRELFCTEFVYSVERDENRAVDGMDFRYRFASANGYPRELVDRYMCSQPCCILEMMIALANAIEENVMDDPKEGNRLSQWFWNMVLNLGLSGMSDDKYNEAYVYSVITNFLERRYSKNGQGGLFVVNHPIFDMRDVEIWYQAMWYLDENFDFSV